MKRLLTLFVLCVAASVGSAESLTWMTDLPAAQAKAKQEKKFVLLDFTGSDWCGWCMKLKREVFDQGEFAEYAKAKLILVELDFPHKIQQTALLKITNQRLAETYHIEGFPTIIVLDSNGKKVGQTGYLPGGAPAFTASLEKMPGLKEIKMPAKSSLWPALAGNPFSTATSTPATNAPKASDLIVLKGLSGTKDHRLALINNEPFSTGDTVRVKVGGELVEVTCTEIRENSVVVRVEGKLRELKLGGLVAAKP